MLSSKIDSIFFIKKNWQMKKKIINYNCIQLFKNEEGGIYDNSI